MLTLLGMTWLPLLLFWNRSFSLFVLDFSCWTDPWQVSAAWPSSPSLTSLTPSPNTGTCVTWWCRCYMIQEDEAITFPGFAFLTARFTRIFRPPTWKLISILRSWCFDVSKAGLPPGWPSSEQAPLIQLQQSWHSQSLFQFLSMRLSPDTMYVHNMRLERKESFITHQSDTLHLSTLGKQGPHLGARSESLSSS